MRRPLLAAGVVLALAAPSSALAQGKSQSQKKTPPPSRNELTAAAVATPRSPATPLAWLDDASVLPVGTAAFSVSAMRWQGGGVSEVDVPVVNGAFGLATRVQLSASVPRIVGSADPAGAAGGVGTSFFSAKIATYERADYGFKVAVAPTLELLGQGIVESLGGGESRVRWGLPVSAEVSRRGARIYGGGGYFSPGLWYSGVAVGLSVNPRTNVSVGVSRAWRAANTPDLANEDRDRNEISGGLSYSVLPSITLFGSIGRTFATLDENGAGTSVSGGVSIFFAAATRRP